MDSSSKPVKDVAMESDEDSSTEEQSYSDPKLTQKPLMPEDQNFTSSSEEEEDDDDEVESNFRPHSPVTPAKRPTPEEETVATNKKMKPTLFQRFWSEDDEIHILKAILNYSSSTNKSGPITSDFDGLHNFVKEKLPNTRFTRVQLQDKIHRLKIKFQKKYKKVKEGMKVTFCNSYENDVYDLSKQIWGVESDDVINVEKKVTRRSMAVTMNVDSRLMFMNHNKISMEENMLIAGRDLGLEGKKEWEELKVAELKLYLKHLEIRIAQTKLVLERMEADGDH